MLSLCLSDVLFQPVDVGAVGVRHYSVHLFLDRRPSDLLIETGEVGDKPLSSFEQLYMTLSWLRHAVHEFVFSFIVPIVHIVHNGLRSTAVAVPLHPSRHIFDRSSWLVFLRNGHDKACPLDSDAHSLR